MTSETPSSEVHVQYAQKVRPETFKNAPTAPHGSVLLGILKSVEDELRKRDLLGTTHSNATPLWFLAETERNVFLWRNGKSIEDHRQFTFWVDVQGLLTKRREQLRRTRSFNPFVSSMWGAIPSDPRALEEEHQYLDCLEDLAATIFKHAEALSHASESIRAELSKTTSDRTTVILPSSPPGPR